MGTDQREVGSDAAVRCGDVLQLAKRRIFPPAHHVRQRQRGAFAGVFGVKLGGFCKVFFGLLDVSVLQINLAGYRVHVRVN